MSKDFLDPRVRDQIMKEKVYKPMTIRQRATAQAIYGQLVQITPVDTSRAKSNWWLDVNHIAVTQREPDNAAAGQAQALSVSKSEIEITDILYITNNLPYINRLNEGYSDKAPALFVESSIQVGNQKGKEYAKRLK